VGARRGERFARAVREHDVAEPQTLR
jgi:hypothetical protein